MEKSSRQRRRIEEVPVPTAEDPVVVPAKKNSAAPGRGPGGRGSGGTVDKAELIRRRKAGKKRQQENLIKALASSEASGTRKKPGNVFQARQDHGKGRKWTVSVALPGSILDNAQSPELRSYLAGQVARALAVFGVDEVVVFDDGDGETTDSPSSASVQLARILQYLECPQYLRKHLFPLHKDLQFAGLLNPTDMPHHVRADEAATEFREGVILDTSSGPPRAFIGVRKECRLEPAGGSDGKGASPGMRVTVRIDRTLEDKNWTYGTAVDHVRPREELGLYWGYSVRLANRLSDVLSGSPLLGNYDLTVGTSERGDDVDACSLKTTEDSATAAPFRRLLVVFGGVKGLEAALDYDPKLKPHFEDPRDLFDMYLNTCPGQSSRTIRTEEAMLITLAALRPKILEAQQGGR